MANIVGQRQGKITLANGKGKLWSNGKGKTCHGAARNFRHGKWQLATGKSVAATDKGLRSNGKGKTSSRTASSVAVKRQGKLWSNGNWANLLRQMARENFRRVNVTANFLGQRQR